MIKKSAQTFSTASWKKSEISMRLSDLYDNSVMTHRNRYSLTLKEFNCISQSYHSSLSYIIRRSDFQANGLQRVRLLTETVLQYSTLMLSSRRKNIKSLRLDKIFEIRIFSDSLNFFHSYLIYFYTHGISFPENTPRRNILLAHFKRRLKDVSPWAYIRDFVVPFCCTLLLYSRFCCTLFCCTLRFCLPYKLKIGWLVFPPILPMLLTIECHPRHSR